MHGDRFPTIAAMLSAGSFSDESDDPGDLRARLIFATAVTYVAVVLVAVSLEAGTVFAQPDDTIDPTTDGLLAHATVLLHGSVTRILDVVLMAALGYAVLRSGAFLRSLGWAAAPLPPCPAPYPWA
ncbi:hypothetical protein [Nonomuraea jiangxiensis]|uniref:Uncharacterized protein n=1 Tax=Nonomuraea jiangxiensis TaxID=633440 RepID=A0A1G9RNF1_9ACTN|nr:hypothetical protein [Nonomuraea jiangxiensis]SDM24743.1 hypothetical protein SAMN05421869_1393 [Nonomuraea jiangxiensis]